MSKLAPQIAFVMGLMLCAGCGPQPEGGDGDGTGSGSGSNKDSGTSSGDDGGGQPLTDGSLILQPDGGSCGNQTVPISVMNLGDPPDMLIVLDRSGSMTTPVDLFNPFGATRWTTMRDALKMLTAARESQIKFGANMFPTDNNCAVAAGTRVPIALNQAAMIATWLNGTSPDGNTPAHLGLQQAKLIYDGLPVNPAGRYVLFATDGEPNCGGAMMDQATETETLAAITALRTAGIKTYVLGFGNSFGSTGAAFLTQAATAGGVPRAGNPNYYAATSAAALQAALNTIAGGIVRPSCSYMLASAPPVPNDVTVKLNGTTVPRSTLHTDGWDYHPDASTITFFGSACTQVMSGSITSVSFVYGCPGPKID